MKYFVLISDISRSRNISIILKMLKMEIVHVYGNVDIVIFLLLLLLNLFQRLMKLENIPIYYLNNNDLN